jgi:GNAT superfamily N-acetyltransferase
MESRVFAAPQDGHGPAPLTRAGQASSLVAQEVALEQTRALRQSVLRPHESVQEMAAGEAERAYAAGVSEGTALIAVGLIAPSPERGDWRVRGMATAPPARNRGAGAAVLDELLRHARANGAASVWCNARTPALRFYERAGFSVVSEVFEIVPIGPHVVMERNLQAAAHGLEPGR